MTALFHRDFFNPRHDADCSYEVVKIYRDQFPDLYRAVDLGQLKTSSGSALKLGGDTLITYKSAIQKIYGKHFGSLDSATKQQIRSALERVSNTSQKRIQHWDDAAEAVINNHQIGNMMPFPSGAPSLNSLRAGGGMYDYFDRFLAEVRNYYTKAPGFHPTSGLQRAIAHQRSYFDFFRTYDKFLEYNLLQDFSDIDLWRITDFEEYLELANQIIDNRGKRFTVQAHHFDLRPMKE